MQRTTKGLVSMAVHGNGFGFYGHVLLRVWLPWLRVAMGLIVLAAYGHRWERSQGFDIYGCKMVFFSFFILENLEIFRPLKISLHRDLTSFFLVN